MIHGEFFNLNIYDHISSDMINNGLPINLIKFRFRCCWTMASARLYVMSPFFLTELLIVSDLQVMLCGGRSLRWLDDLLFHINLQPSKYVCMYAKCSPDSRRFCPKLHPMGRDCCYYSGKCSSNTITSFGMQRNGKSITLRDEEELNSDALFHWVTNKTETGADAGAPPRLSLFFSGMFFDGNHTYMIEPGGQGSSHVSTLEIYMKMYAQCGNL